METYMDDILIKSVKGKLHANDLQEVFECIHLHNVRLSPSKCAFGLSLGKFLRFMISECGIKEKPEKLKAIEEIKSLTHHREIQYMNGRLATLNSFISKESDRDLPFLKFCK